MPIDDQKLKELEKQSVESERRVLVIAKIKAQNSVNQDPSAPNLTALERAAKMLSDYDSRMAGPAGPSFANRVEALEWLQRQGYKIKKSKLYQDCKKGLLKLQDDGSVFELDLKKYARKAALNKLSETPDADSGDLQVQKAEAEIEKLRSQNKLLQVQLDEKLRKYIIRSDFEMEFAARVSVLKFGIEHMIYSYAFEWKELVLTGDKVSATQRLIDNMKQVVKKQFNDFANIKNFEVVFLKEELTEDFITESTEK
jgi:hypothetical protein